MFSEGQVLNNTYRVVRLIGEGGMGLVYEAAHARLAGRYAIKVLLQKLSDNPEALARFDREARITSSLQHPNIVQVIDFNTHSDGTEYLVMEYLQGETLAERLARRGALPLDMVVSIVEQVAAGLAAAHSHTVVHRDLKPDNIFLVPVEGRQLELAKVLDFGISKARDINHGLRGPESALMGTPQYMSPEQCQGRTGAVDATTDQFALAVITYEMLTGHPPFTGDSVGTVLSQVLYADPPPMNLDSAIDAVVRRGLSKSGVDRFPSVTAFATALHAAVASRRISGPQTDDLLNGGETLRADQLGSLSGDLSDQLSHLAFDPTIRGKTGRPKAGRHWGALALAGGAVAVGLFFVVAANSVDHDRNDQNLGMLPAPAVPKGRIVDLTLQPPRLPSLATTVTPPPPTGREQGREQVLNGDGAPGEEPGARSVPAMNSEEVRPQKHDAAFVNDDAHRALERREALRRAAEQERAQQESERRELERHIAERRELERRELERRQSRPELRTVERKAPAPSSAVSQGASAPPRSARSSSGADDDAILPLDESNFNR